MPKISCITPSIRPEGLKIVQESLKNQTFKDFEWIVDINYTGEHDLNQAFNRCLKRAKGELIVFYQDYIKAPDNALQSLWEAYERDNSMLYTCPVGKSDDYANPRYDWRKDKIGEIAWNEWEIDFGSAPLKVLKEIGGFDEELDKYWSCDNVNTAYRAFLKGYRFECIDVPVIALDHDKFEEHPFRKNYKPSFNNQRMQEFESGLTIDYLNS